MGGGAEVVRGVNKLILSGDMVAVDSYCARLLARHDETFTPDVAAMALKHAAALGLGKADLDAAGFEQSSCEDQALRQDRESVVLDSDAT